MAALPGKPFTCAASVCASQAMPPMLEQAGDRELAYSPHIPSARLPGWLPGQASPGVLGVAVGVRA